MLVVVALGGNALLQRGQPLEADVQRRNVLAATTAIAEVAREHRVVVTHGNGPQVGLLAVQGMAYKAVRPYPLDVLGAETEGMIGYLLEQELGNALPGYTVATLLTQVLVDAHDPAFGHPTKPIGPLYTDEEAHRVRDLGWTVAPDGPLFRRVVPSPEPRDIVELSAIRLLLTAGVLVICVGGGGIPVLMGTAGALRGTEAVIDKDLSSALLAVKLRADALLVLTDVAAVQRDWGTPTAQAIGQATPAELRTLRFAEGSMAPKVEAACRFVEATGGMAAIGPLDAASAMLRGEAGTVVRPS